VEELQKSQQRIAKRYKKKGEDDESWYIRMLSLVSALQSAKWKADATSADLNHFRSVVMPTSAMDLRQPVQTNAQGCNMQQTNQPHSNVNMYATISSSQIGAVFAVAYIIRVHSTTWVDLDRKQTAKVLML